MSKTHVGSASRRAVIPLLALVLAGLTAAPRAQAQANPNPPEQLTYQGYVVDANGNPLGADAPKNYDVIFRIWSDPTATDAGNRLWTEQQTVTVDNGYFSVLLGEGADISEPRPPLSALFSSATASDRWVSLTVKGIGAGSPPADVDILPRIRLLTSPYAFLASKAMSVDGTALTSGTVPDARLSGNVALRAGGNSFSGSQNFNANIGLIRSQGGLFTTAAHKVTHLELHNGQNPTTGWTYRLRTGADTGGASWFAIEAPTDGAGNSAEMLRIEPLGVSVRGFGSVSGRFDVFGTIRQFGDSEMQNGKILYAKNSANILEPVFWPRWTDNATYLNYGVAGLNIRNNASQTAMSINNNGTVQVAGELRATAITANNRPVAVGDENLRIIRGNVSKTGTVLNGTGFTVTKPTASGSANGKYIITFSTAFSNIPTVTANNYDVALDNEDNFILIQSPSVNSVTLISRDVDNSNSGSSRQDSGFTFIAIGPR